MSELTRYDVLGTQCRDGGTIVRFESVCVDGEWVKADDALKHIAELEEAVSILVEQHNMWKQQWKELSDSLPKRDLEQQAKGVEDFRNKYELCEPHNWHFRAGDYIKKLKQKAEQMK